MSAPVTLKLAVVLACAASSTAFVVPAPHRTTTTVQQPRRARARALRASESLSPAERTWSARRKLARAAFDAQLGWNRIDDEAADEADAAGADAETTSDAAANTVGTTAFGVVVVALVLRFGGRAALLQVLGLDVAADTEIAQRIDDFVTWSHSFDVIPGYEDATLLLLYCGAFIVAKVGCVDPLTFALAISSGVLFGGVVNGALVATACATIGSSVAFGLARYGRPRLREKLLVLVRRDAKTRALERAVAERGFVTVLVLRLAPLLPIPIGGYNYLYGATDMSFLAFAPAMFLGSLKPYAFDAYLGVVGKTVVDDVASGAPTSQLSDPVLVGVFAAFLAIGALSSELATEAWRDIEAESLAEEEKRSAGGGALEDAYPEGDWLDVLEVREGAPWRALEAAREKVAEAEPDGSKALRRAARRARRALATMAREELALARVDDAAARAEEGLPPREATAAEDAARAAFVDRFAVRAPAADAAAGVASVVPPESDAELQLPQALLESTLFSYVVFRALLDEASLDDP